MPVKILIAEDNLNNQKLLHDILHYHGYEVLMAENGKEAVRVAREERPDLICMDLQMPGIDGLTVIGMLRKDPVTKGIRIIAVTSLAMVGDREKALQAGADDYISKPFDTRELPLLIRKHLGGCEESYR